MRQQRTSQRTPRPRLTVRERDLTVEEARAMRDDQARLTAHFADRVERARAAGQYGPMRRWMQEYRRAALQCRLLGERIRREPGAPVQTAANRSSVLARLAPRPSADIPPAGEGHNP